MSIAVREAIKGPIRLDGRPLHRGQEQALRSWLGDFPAAVRSVEEQQLARAGERLWVVLPNDRLAGFRKAARASLNAVRAEFRSMHMRPAPPEVVYWCLENRDDLGLSAVEAEAVFGAYLAIDRLCAARADSRRTKLLIRGRLRRECVGGGIQIDAVTGAIGAVAAALLTWQLSRDHALVPFIFLSDDTARALAHGTSPPMAAALETAFRRGARAALWVPRDRTTRVLADPASACEALSALAAHPVRLVAFEDPDALAEPAMAWAHLQRAGLTADASMLAGSAPRAPYLEGGAYFPQPFDLRTPSGARASDVPLEIVRVDASRAGWRRRWDDRFADLRPLLDFDRMADFHERMAREPLLAQQYHEYRVYNWPAPPPSPRTTLLWLGRTSNPGGLMRAVARVNREAALRPATFLWTPPEHLLASAADEALSRLPRSETAALADQRDRHEYLRDVGAETLRADTAAFAQFIPGELRAALEIGAGLGALARALRHRASRYVCLDLDPAVVRQAAGPCGEGAAADTHRLPFRSRAFNSVIANNVLEHSFDPRAALHEIARVLADNGRLYALLPGDALNPRYELRAHHWKIHADSIAGALRMGGLSLRRLVDVDIYKLGVAGSFPSCNGIVYAIEAARA